MAAAAIYAVKLVRPDQALIDPTCGSGTFCRRHVIARNMAPDFVGPIAKWNWVDRLILKSVEASPEKSRSSGYYGN